jgi:hypothetical protein
MAPQSSMAFLNNLVMCDIASKGADTALMGRHRDTVMRDASKRDMN